MAMRTDVHQNKHHFRDNVIPESNEGLDVGVTGQRFNTGRFKAIICDTLDVITLTVTTIVSVTINTLTVATGLTLSFLGAGYVKTNSSGVVSAQAVPIPMADGGTNSTSIAAGYVKSNGTTLITSTDPIPIANGGTASATAAAARTALGVAPLDPTFVTLSANAELSNERVLTAGTNVTITDNGAGSTVVIAATSGPFNPIANQVFGG